MEVFGCRRREARLLRNAHDLARVLQVIAVPRLWRDLRLFVAPRAPGDALVLCGRGRARAPIGKCLPVDLILARPHVAHLRLGRPLRAAHSEADLGLGTLPGGEQRFRRLGQLASSPR
jgi:hypothetical protein